MILTTPFVKAAAAIILHVVNYNATAQIEYNTRIFTKIFGSIAIYLYAAYLVASALLRDHFINLCLQDDQHSFPSQLRMTNDTAAFYISSLLFGFGIFLNLWTLKALGIKGMYNGDSFGYLFDAPVTGGPYTLFNDPQYVGTTLAMLGSAYHYHSLQGLALTALMGIVFYISVKFVEGPHMNRIYSNPAKSKKRS
eukprot:TRINITY_DN6958_c0_g1_i2.p1 TRINITY_DN6958_c0_g1~~TRINITY_DN6958_c0_g1_i2.p1  ORF type:complete len:195 (-),score=15.54 TRINITY_DN6958_c0_g1_i2:98-682(-)